MNPHQFIEPTFITALATLIASITGLIVAIKSHAIGVSTNDKVLNGDKPKP